MFKPANKIMCLISTAFLVLYTPVVTQAATLGSVSESLLGPTAIVTQILMYACYIVGITFCFMAIAQYKVHRDSPKLVPLSTPVMLLIFGVILGLVPYFSTLFKTGSALEYAKERGLLNEEHDGLALPPLEHPPRNGPGDFLRPSENRPSDKPAERDSSGANPKNVRPGAGAAPPPPPNGGGHWSDDPNYRSLP